MDNFIRETIVDVVGGYRGRTAYRTPLVGFAAASDQGFAGLRDVVGPGHLIPHDLLPGARTVVAFFVPFDSELVCLQREDSYVSRAWAEAYIETNRLIESVCGALGDALAEKGIMAAWQQPTHNFDPVELVSIWSHKHVAYLCGLGSFGRHRMLITRAGCAGRLGSLVTDAALPEETLAPHKRTADPTGEICLTWRGGPCDACIRRCPSGALTTDGFDRQRCYRYLLEVNDHFPDLGLCHVCGKCATGPCALSIPSVE